VNELDIPSTFYGIPLAVRRADAQQLVIALTAYWERQMGKSPGEFIADLDSLKLFFDPLARGERLRKLIANLPPLPLTQSRLIRAPLVLKNKQEALVTLEGRVAIEVLSQLLERGSSDPLIISADSVCAYERYAADRYRAWSMRRIEDVVRLMSGQAGALGIPSIGWLLFLLVNGSRSPDTALRLNDLSDLDQEKLEFAVRRIVASFSNALAPGNRDDRHFGIYQGYALTEARRRLPGAIGSGDPYILQGKEKAVIDLVSAELTRPQRSFNVTDIMQAYDSLVAAYREERPILAILELAHDRRAETRRIRELLERALERDYGHPGFSVQRD
jgi:hypothetical protein